MSDCAGISLGTLKKQTSPPPHNLEFSFAAGKFPFVVEMSVKARDAADVYSNAKFSLRRGKPV